MTQFKVGDRVRRLCDQRLGTVVETRKDWVGVKIDGDDAAANYGSPNAFEPAPAIDWSAPLEAYHPDGRVQRVERCWSSGNEWGICPPVRDGIDSWDTFNADGSHWKGQTEWRVRNRIASSVPARDPALVERMVELLRRVDERNEGGPYAADVRALLHELDPVDPLVLRAREIAAIGGYEEDEGVVQIILRALREPL